jgi:hypothetical protein
MSLLILVVDDEPDVEKLEGDAYQNHRHCNNPSATCHI